ncbi:MAG: tetratricopeptide repeat protein [Cyanobacteria bacterium J06635_15]
MINGSRWRSRLIAVTLAVATWLLVTVSAQSTPPFHQDNNLPLQAAFSHNTRQTKQQDSGSTVLLEVEGTLEAGDLTLENGSLYDIHSFEGEVGQTVTIRMISDEFDTFIGLVDSARQPIDENNDTTASETNSTLTMSLPEAGTYFIIAIAFDNAGQGNYRLTVSTANPAEIQALEADRLLSQGNQHYRARQFRAAVESWQQALEIYQAIGEAYGTSKALRAGEAITLDNLGLAYFSLGQYQQAIEFHQQALEIAREIENPRLESSTLGNLGRTYFFLGQYQQSLELHQQALEIVREIGDLEGEAGLLGNLGNVYDYLGQYQQAIELRQQALALQRELRNRRGEANSLGNLGTAYYSLGQYQRAIEFHQQALEIAREIGDRGGEAITLGNLGNAYDSLGQHQQAIEFHQQSLAIKRELGNRQGEAISLNNLSVSLIKTNQFSEAEITLKQAIETYESLRTDLSDAQLISIADTQAAAYTLLEQVLITQGKPAEALETSERARARAFVLQLASRLSNREESATLAEPEATPPPTITNIQQIARDQNATLVTYSLIFDQALYIWVVQPSGEIEFRLVELDGSGSLPNPVAAIDGPVYRGSSDPSELDTLVAETRAGIGVVEAIPTERLKDLHQVLIEPIADLLPSDPDANVVFMPQGSLFLVPFAALQDADDTYLIEKHTVLTAPSIQVFGLAAREEAQGRSSEFSDGLVVGNPVMPQAWIPGDNGLEELQLAPLPGAEAEALAIGDFLNISPLIGAQATEAQIKQQLPSAPLIHLATHGLLEYGNPKSSGVLDVPGALALTSGDGEDGLLTAAEILDMDLQAQLAVLSACDTGRGRITGDGVVGLSRSLITAGVPSVIVSLWAVPDAPTAALMTAFYHQLQQGQSKAQALRQAMLATLKDSPEPINWAAFTLMGAVE